MNRHVQVDDADFGVILHHEALRVFRQIQITRNDDNNFTIHSKLLPQVIEAPESGIRYDHRKSPGISPVIKDICDWIERTFPSPAARSHKANSIRAENTARWQERVASDDRRATAPIVEEVVKALRQNGIKDEGWLEKVVQDAVKRGLARKAMDPFS
ncbi:MAG: hypothetical protein AB7F82_06560 [Alphaproteobacteria bacterium]